MDKKIKNQFLDNNGNIIKTEYYEEKELYFINQNNLYEEELNECISKRMSAYQEKWPTIWEWNDDIIARGDQAVYEDKKAIKAQFPKPVKQKGI